MVVTVKNPGKRALAGLDVSLDTLEESIVKALQQHPDGLQRSALKERSEFNRWIDVHRPVRR